MLRDPPLGWFASRGLLRHPFPLFDWNYLVKSANRSPRTRNKNQLRYQALEHRNLLSANLPSMDVHIELTRDYLGSQVETQSLVQEHNDIRFIETKHGLSSSTSLFQPTHQDLPVFNSYLTVEHDLRGGFMGFQANSASALSGAESTVPVVPMETAEQTVMEHLGFRDGLSSQLVWSESGMLSWQVDVTNAAGGDLVFLVDAHRGDIVHEGQPTSTSQLIYNPDTQTGVFERIVINDTIGPAGSRDYASTFDAVVALPGCTGTLVAPNVVVSARHCGSSPGDTIRFGEDSSNPIHSVTVDSVQLPAGNGTLLDGGDFNILILAEDVPNSVAEPMRLVDLTDDLEGMLAATVGYGLNGIGSEGHQGSSDGFRWGGENIIDVYGTPASSSGNNIISTDFDDGTAGANTIPAGDMNPLEFEATTAPGDSGGPILIQVGSEWVVAGVLSGGTTSTSVYGDISWWTGVAPYRAQIEAAGGVFVEGSVGFDQESYFIGETVTITVEDAFASGPVDVTVTSSSGDSEILTLAGTAPTFSSTIDLDGTGVVQGDGLLQVAANNTITVQYGVAAIDEATIEVDVITGTPGNDIIDVIIDDTTTVTINGDVYFFDTALTPALSLDAMGGYDQITILDSRFNDSVSIMDKQVTVDGQMFFVSQNVESVEVTSGGGSDSARIYGTTRNELFESLGDRSRMTGDGFVYGVVGFSNVVGVGVSGDDRAAFTDSDGDDRFFGSRGLASLTTPTGVVIARDFDKVSIHSGGSGYDLASLVGTDGDETLYATEEFAYFTGDGIELTAAGFDRTWTNGGGGDDVATLIGTDGDDIFNSQPLNSYLYSPEYFNQVVRFNNVTANAGLDGNDRAILRDTPGEDRFFSTPLTSVMFSEQYRSRATGFGRVTAIASAGYDIATFIDSAGDDRYIARPDDAYLIGDGFLNYAREFDRVDAKSSGGMDIAVLRGSFEDNRVFANRNSTHLSGLNFFNAAENFRRVTIELNTSGFHVGVFQDSTLDDTFIGSGNNATLVGQDYLVVTTNLDRVTAITSNGGRDVLAVQDPESLDYAFSTIGDWVVWNP